MGVKQKNKKQTNKNNLPWIFSSTQWPCQHDGILKKVHTCSLIKKTLQLLQAEFVETEFKLIKTKENLWLSIISIQIWSLVDPR